MLTERDVQVHIWVTAIGILDWPQVISVRLKSRSANVQPLLPPYASGFDHRLRIKARFARIGKPSGAKYQGGSAPMPCTETWVPRMLHVVVLAFNEVSQSTAYILITGLCLIALHPGRIGDGVPKPILNDL